MVRTKINKKRFLAFYLLMAVVNIFFCCLLTASVWAQAEDQGKEKEPIICDGDNVEYLEEEKKIVGTGNVAVTYKEAKLTADKIVLFPETQDALAYGNVVLHKGKDIFSGEQLSYNFETQKGTAMDSRFETVPWYGRGEKMDKVAENNVLVRKGYITTCELDPPHYRIQSRRIKIYLGDKIVAKNVLFFVDRIPMLYMPYYSHPLNDDRPRVTIIPGKKKDWGIFVLSAWRYYFNENARGYIRLDWRELLGVAEGLDYNFKTQDYGEGKFSFYYTQERKKELPEGVHAERQRYRVDYTHEWDIDEDTRLLGEYHRWNERDFRKDYFYQEYRKESNPETQISVTRLKSNYSLEGYLRKRVNRFENVVEKLPELSLDVSDTELGSTNLYYSGTLSAANLNIKNSHSEKDTDANRADNYNQISYPTQFPRPLRWISFNPYVGERQTYYSKNIVGDQYDFIRGIYYGGYDLSTRFYRIFDVNTEFWNIDINNLRHVIQPSIQYDYIHRPTIQSSRVGAFDSIDAITKSNAYEFSIGNTLQTKWPGKEEKDLSKKDKEEGLSKKNMESVDLARFRTKTYFYPHPEELVSPFSNIYFELDLMPYRWLTTSIDSSYDHSTRDFDTVNIDLTADKTAWDFTLGSRYVRDTSTELTTDLNYILSDKWKFGVYERYEFKTNIFNEQEYRLTRDLHCWLMDIAYNIKDGETVWIIFRLKAFPEIPFEFDTAYHVAKAGSQDPNVTKK